jgi:hypothetical protein
MNAAMRLLGRALAVTTLLEALIACRKAPAQPSRVSPPPEPSTSRSATAASTPDASSKLDEALPVGTKLVAQGAIREHHLGSELYLSIVTLDTRKSDGSSAKPAPHVRLARVAPDGSLEELATGMPDAEWATMRTGQLTISGTVSALLGEPGGPMWMAFTRYNVFGNATIYRAERGTWQCVGACTSPTGDAEPWAPVIQIVTPLGDREPSGDLVAERSRGHLFFIKNRVSGEGDAHVLPSAKGLSAREAVARIRPQSGEMLAELGDGSIVDVKKIAPEVGEVRDADGLSARDVWVLGERGLVHVRGAAREHVELPDGAVSAVFVELNGAVWLSGGSTVHHRARSDATWRTLAYGPASDQATVAAVRGDAVFVMTSAKNGALRLLRVTRT